MPSHEPRVVDRHAGPRLGGVSTPPESVGHERHFIPLVLGWRTSLRRLTGWRRGSCRSWFMCEPVLPKRVLVRNSGFTVLRAVIFDLPYQVQTRQQPPQESDGPDSPLEGMVDGLLQDGGAEQTMKMR